MWTVGRGVQNWKHPILGRMGEHPISLNLFTNTVYDETPKKKWDNYEKHLWVSLFPLYDYLLSIQITLKGFLRTYGNIQGMSSFKVIKIKLL